MANSVVPAPEWRASSLTSVPFRYHQAETGNCPTKLAAIRTAPLAAVHCGCPTASVGLGSSQPIEGGFVQGWLSMSMPLAKAALPTPTQGEPASRCAPSVASRGSNEILPVPVGNGLMHE